MTQEALISSLSGIDPLERLWNLLAFLARYARQDVTSMLKMETRDLLRLSKAIARIVEQEKTIEGD